MGEVLFRRLSRTGHEQVLFGNDERTGLRAIVAVHSTVLGPALGGTRWYPYDSADQALDDVLRLSEAMTYKASAAGLDLGGGKAVIIGDPADHDHDEILAAYARVVDSLGGRYLTAEDVGTTVADMVAVRRATSHVAGLPVADGGSGDPSPMTARGVLAALRATARDVWGEADLTGRRVAVAGVGKVGSALVGLLVAAGCEVLVSDVDEAAVQAVVEAYGATPVAPDEILLVGCDVLSPCAMGGVLDDATIPALSCTAVVGAANNQLASGHHAQALRARGITYAPDFVVNAGGLINIAHERGGYDAARAGAHVDAIADTVARVLDLARERDVDTHSAALQLARARIDAASEGA